MNYLKIYFAIIAKAAGREPSILYDKHHIIPQSLGGPDVPTNWIYLTPREHMVAHHLLARAYPDVELLQSGFNLKKVCIKYYDYYRWSMRLKDLAGMIEYSKNKKEIITRLRVLLDAIGDVDLDKHIPVKQQPNMVKPKPATAEKPEKPEPKKSKKKSKE
jgi:hypothetical protein